MIIIPKITRQMHGNDSENDKEMTKINLSAKAQWKVIFDKIPKFITSTSS